MPLFSTNPYRLVVFLSVVLLLHEEMLVCAVCGESNGRNAQSWKGGLEAVESGEWSGVSPLLAETQAVSICIEAQQSTCSLSEPWITTSIAGGGCEGLWVEAGKVWACRPSNARSQC